MQLTVREKQLLQQFFAGKPIIKAYLFGSFARNDANEHSDIDILVELDHTQPIGMKFFTFQNDIENLLNKKVDLVSTGGISKFILPIVDKEKILIYDRSVN